MPYDPITLLSTLSTIVLPPDTQDSLSVSWLDSYRMGFPPMKHYTLCWAHTGRLPLWQYPIMYFNRKHRAAQDRPNNFLHSSVSISGSMPSGRLSPSFVYFSSYSSSTAPSFQTKASLALPLPESIGPQITLSASSM